MEIPTRRSAGEHESPSSLDLDGQPLSFVGSPEQRYGALTSQYQTPSRGTKVIKRVLSEVQPSAAGSHPQRAASGLPSGSILSRSVPKEKPWLLFGQLMENEGQLRSPKATPRKAQNIPLIRELNQVSPRASPQISQRPSSAETEEGRVQSPVSDPFLEAQEYFPPVGTSRLESTTEYDSDSSVSSGDTIPEASAPPGPPWFLYQRLIPIPRLYKNILKCSIAYFLGSLFTFVPYLSGTIADIITHGPGPRGPSASGHMIATVTVYYNPAKTVGAMVEADVFCLMGLLFSAFVSLCSMSLFWWLDVKPGWEWLADAIVILLIGVSMSAVAWMKAWMAKPSFNSACSMTAIILFIVFVKEGGLRTLLQVSFLVFVGAVVSNLVCYALWPQSAVHNLRRNMATTLDSFATLLRLLNDTFLLEEPPHPPSNQKLQKAVENHQSSFTGLKKNLEEAHSEWFFSGGRAGPRNGASAGRAYEDAVGSLNRLAQHLNGLRGGTRLQYELAKANSDGKVVLKKRPLQSNSPVLSSKRHERNHGPGHPSMPGDDDAKGKAVHANEGEESEEAVALLRAAAVMFGDLVDDLGPPMQALSSTCIATLKRMRAAFLRSGTYKETIEEDEFHALVDGIERALYAFESTSNHAVMRLYRRTDMTSTTSWGSGGDGSFGDGNMVLTGSESENVFLVYFFIFTLQEFARELVSLLDAMGRIYALERQQHAIQPWWARIWAKSWTLHPGAGFPDPPRQNSKKKPGLRRHISAVFIPHNHRQKASFPKVRPHAPNTIQTPARSKLTSIGRAKQSLWALGARLKQRDLKYAFKAGMATAMLAAPAFIDATRPTFVEYRGEWALISFFVVISPTIGATNFLSVHRVLGTLFGAAVAVMIHTAFPENPYVLSIFGFFYSLPCFYYIVAKPEFATTARFVLLTYNLTCLYCYNQRDTDLSVQDVAFHRSVAVTAGVIWAGIVSRFWWPAEARKELSDALGEFCLNIGWLYTRLVASNSFAAGLEGLDNHGGDRNEVNVNETSTLLTKPANTRLDNSIREFMSMELHLQIKLIELQGLLAQTVHEPRLKGPFPVQLYRSMLTSLQTILDRLHSMRCVTTREEWYTTVRHDFIIPVNREAREMVGNIILALSTLASAYRLKAPLPPYLPPVEQSRQRLVDAIRQLDVVKNRDVKGSRQLLFFAYALTMKGVTQELEILGRTLQDAFGVIGQSPEEFEALFQDQRTVENNV